MCSFYPLPVAKNHNFWQILTFWELLYRPPFTDEGQIWYATADPRYTFTIYLRNFVSIGLFCRPVAAKNPNVAVFAVFGLWHLVTLPTGINLRKLSTGAQQQTFDYPTASKSFLYSNTSMAKSGAQALTFKSVTDRQTDRQKTQRF